MDNLLEYLRVVVELGDYALQQLVDALANVTVYAFLHVVGVAQTRELVQHLHGAMRPICVLIEKLRLPGRELVQCNFQALNPFAYA